MVPWGSTEHSTRHSHRASWCPRLPLSSTYWRWKLPECEKCAVFDALRSAEKLPQYLRRQLSQYIAPGWRHLQSRSRLLEPYTASSGGKRRPTAPRVRRANAAEAHVPESPTCGNPGRLPALREHRDGNLRTPCATRSHRLLPTRIRASPIQQVPARW